MEIQTNIRLKNKNWFETGGPARFFCQPTTAQEFQQGLSYATENSLDTFVLGQGANILISDSGFDGLVIAPKINGICGLNPPVGCSFTDSTVTAGAGRTIQECIDWCLDNNFLGLEEFSGIPGSIGGATYMNIHYFDRSLSDLFKQAQVINKDTLEIKTVDKEWFAFGYDQSKLQAKEWFLINATLKLKACTPQESCYAKGRRDEIIRHRNARYPHSHTCGSFFRNFHADEVSHTKKKLPYVAYYLDKSGLKGELQHGDAIVSHQHANMIVNKGNATSDDIISLARAMQKIVFETFGVMPQPECQFVGFHEEPLEPPRPHRPKSSHDTAPSVGP